MSESAVVETRETDINEMTLAQLRSYYDDTLKDWVKARDAMAALDLKCTMVGSELARRLAAGESA